MLSSLLLLLRTQDMGGDPFGMLLRQRIVFLGGEVGPLILYSLANYNLAAVALLCP